MNMKRNKIDKIYFDVKHALEVHDIIIQKSGGRKGILNQGYLESILYHIQNDNYYPEFLDKITHLCFSVNKLHSFIDGNKRTSIALSAYFLKINGYEHCILHFIREMENIAVWIAENKVKKDLLRNIIEDIIMLEDREETKLALLCAISNEFCAEINLKSREKTL
jgi:death on curing protein